MRLGFVGRRLAVLGQNVQLLRRVQLPAVLRAVDAFVEAAGPRRGTPLVAAFDQRNRDVRVGALAHDLAAELEPVFVVDDANRNAVLRWRPGLAIGNPVVCSSMTENSCTCIISTMILCSRRRP